MVNTPRFAPAEAITHLSAWANADPHGRDDTLLLQAYAPSWMGGLVEPPHVRDVFQGGPAIRITLAKPGKEGPTHRDLDPEGFALTLALCIPGGKLRVERQGPEGEFYYLRLETDHHPGFKGHRRTNVLALVSGTPIGNRAPKQTDYHSLRRCDLRLNSSRFEGAFVRAKGYALDRFREVVSMRPDAFPAGFDADAYARLLDAIHARLKAVPLGQSPYRSGN